MLEPMKGIHNDKEQFLFPLSPKLRRKYILFYIIRLLLAFTVLFFLQIKKINYFLLISLIINQRLQPLLQVKKKMLFYFPKFHRRIQLKSSLIKKKLK